ncbi:MAG: hypothetical protein WCD86_04920 [Ktedonobacteraceae bacterium]
MKSNRKISLAITTVVVLSLASLLLLTQLKTASATVPHVTASSMSAICKKSDIASAEVGVPRIDLSQVALPAGMPKVAAIVNGQDIPSAELESQVAVIQANHKVELSQLPTNAPKDFRSRLTTSTSEARREALDSIIQETVLLQKGIKNGEVASVSRTQSYMQMMLDSIQTSPAYISFMAYLCANKLTKASFLTNSVVVHTYQDALTIGSVKSSYFQTLPASIQNNPGEAQSRMTNYIQSLQKAAKIQILLPSSFLTS